MTRHGQWHRDRLDQVDRLTGPDRDQATARSLPDKGLELADHAGREAPADDLSVGGVLGRIQRQQELRVRVRRRPRRVGLTVGAADLRIEFVAGPEAAHPAVVGVG